MNNKTKFKVGDKVKRVKYIDGVWSELCYYNQLDKHGIHTVTFVPECNYDDGIGVENMYDTSCTGRANFTFDASCFELVETQVDSFIAVVLNNSVVINGIAYPAKLIKDIAAALNSIQ